MELQFPLMAVKVSTFNKWALYCVKCAKSYASTNPSEPTGECARISYELRKKHFVQISNKESNYALEKSLLENAFQQIENECRNPTKLVVENLLNNTTWGPMFVLQNILYVPKLNLESLLGIKEFLIKTGIKTALESHFNSFVGVANVRAYRFSHVPFAHYEEKHIDPSGFKEINVHRDHGLPKNTVKIMIGRSTKRGEIVGLEHGLTEVEVEKKWISVKDEEYAIFIFNSRKLPHKACRPSEGCDRDMIEITVCPREENDFIILQAGNFAGVPEDPFKKWNE
jgi:hypothetical protein